MYGNWYLVNSLLRQLCGKQIQKFSFRTLVGISLGHDLWNSPVVVKTRRHAVNALRF